MAGFDHLADLFGFGSPETDAEPPPADEEGTALERARTHLQSGKYERAVALFKQAVHEAGANPELLVELADAYSYGDATPEAYRQYLRARKLSAESTDAAVGISDLLRRQGRNRESAEELERAIATHPDVAELRYRLASLLRGAGFKERALSAIREAVVRAPDQSFFHYWTADLLLELRRFDEAILAVQAAVELSPGDDHLYVLAALAFWGADRSRDAIKAIRLASELNPDNRVTLGLKHRLLLATGDMDGAREMEHRVAALDPYDREQLLRLLREVELV